MNETSASKQIRPAWLSIAAYSGMFTFGIVMALLGAILPLVSERLHFGLAQAGNLFFALNAAMLITTLALGPLLDRFGMRPAFVAAPVFVAGAVCLVGGAASFGGLVIAIVLLGIGGAALNQSTNTLIADLHRDERKKGAALNLLGVFFGFGALFIPFTIGALLDVLGLKHILYAAAALTLVTVALSLRFSFPRPQQSSGVPFAQVIRLARQPLVIAFALLLFFESGNEFILGGYITSYLTRTLGATVATASYLLAAYWGALMLARIILSRMSLRVGGQTLMLASALGVAASVALLILAPSLLVAAIATVLLGFSIAAIFPTALALAGSRYASHSGTVFGILIGVALFGGITLPLLAGRIAEDQSLRFGLSLAIVDALAIFALQLIAGRIIGRQGHVQ
jgi:fucose permease